MAEPNRYVADPNNPGWYLDPTKDAGLESSWAKPPEGFVPDPNSHGWFYNPTGDPANKDTWWHDASIAVENDAAITIQSAAGRVAGRFAQTPRGVVLHGSRSGTTKDTQAEYEGTVNYVRNGTDGTTGWNVTVGDNIFCQHLAMNEYGWHARAASPYYLSAEFAQANRYYPISDEQINAFCAWFKAAQAEWPDLPLHFPTHADVEASGETGQRDGKDDPFLHGDERADELRQRILTALGF